jgi:Uma2 family endonuclease
MGAPIEDTAIGREALIGAGVPCSPIPRSPIFHTRSNSISLAGALRRDLGGKAFQECAILTPQRRVGRRRSSEFVARHAAVFKSGEPLLQEAPEICVEIKSPSNSLGELKEKIDAYLAVGAIEAWIVLDDLSARFFDVDGERENSLLEVDLEVWRKEVG